MRLHGFILLCACILVGCENNNKQLEIVVSAEEPSFTVAKSIEKILEANEFDVELTQVESREDIIDALHEQHTLGLVEEPNKASTHIATVAPLYPSVLHVLYNPTIVLDTSSIEKLLTEHSIYAGPKGSASHILLLSLLDQWAIKPDKRHILDNPWQAIPDIYFIFGGLLSEESLSDLSNYRLYDFMPADESQGSYVDGIVLRNHNLRDFVIPNGTYRAIGERKTETLAIRTVLAANASLSENLAYDIYQILEENSELLAESYGLVRNELHSNLNPSDFILRFHEGSRRYLARDQPTFVERYVEVLAFYFTLLLAVFSGLFTIVKYRQQQRKDRMDIYYNQLLECRKLYFSEDGVTPLNSKYCELLNKQVRQIQGVVFELVIDERLDANDALLVFINFSNHMLNEIESLKNNS